MRDINLDGKLDVAVLEFVIEMNNYRVVVLTGDGTGHFSSPLRLPAGQQPQDVIFADLNGDGRPDLVSSSFSNVYTRGIPCSNGVA